MGSEPEEIKKEIDETRERLGETVEELAFKLSEKADEAKDKAKKGVLAVFALLGGILAIKKLIKHRR